MLQAFFEDVAQVVDIHHRSHRLSLPPPPVSYNNSPLTVIEREVGVFNQETTVERKGVRFDVNITGLLVG